MDHGKLIEIIRGATEEVFTMMLGLPLDHGKAYQEQADPESFDGVIALVGLAGAWVGAGRICCPAPLACRVSGALLATEYTAVNEEVLDAMAEIANMIIGNVKSRLEDDYGAMGLSIPTVIFGRNYRTRSSGGGAWTVVPFLVDGERLDVRLCLTAGADAAAQRPDAAVHRVS